MKTKFLYIAALALCLVACENETPYETQSEDDAPLILKPYNESGTGSFTYNVANPETPLVDSVIVTPSKYTTVNWIVDGTVVCKEKKINMCFSAGLHSLVIEAVTTKGKRTERTGSINVGGGVIPSDAVTLFSGTAHLAWNENNIKLTKSAMSAVPVGATIYIAFNIWPAGDPKYVEASGERKEYQTLRIIADWDNDILPQVSMSGANSPFVFTFDEEDKKLLDTYGSMSLVGWGLTITKIAYK